MTEEELVADMSRQVIPNIYKDSDASALRRAKVSTRSSVVGLTETTPAADDAPLQRQRAATHDSGETVERRGLVVLRANPQSLSNLLGRLHSRKNSNDHAILRLEALLGELGEEDAEEARVVFDPVRRNLERRKDVKDLVEFLTSLFAPVKQRIAGKRDRLSSDMAQVEQEMRLFEGANRAPEVIKIED
jgi:hypothetical protein